MTLTTTKQEVNITMTKNEANALNNALMLITRSQFYSQLNREEQKVLLALGFASI